jgi:hypothetical protein
MMHNAWIFVDGLIQVLHGVKEPRKREEGNEWIQMQAGSKLSGGLGKAAQLFDGAHSVFD